jgi:hypothetical protein
MFWVGLGKSCAVHGPGKGCAEIGWALGGHVLGCARARLEVDCKGWVCHRLGWSWAWPVMDWERAGLDMVWNRHWLHTGWAG